MSNGQYKSFRPDPDEGWRLAAAGLELLVPGATLLMQLAESAYKRRDLIFDKLGMPRQAYASGKSLPLRSLTNPADANSLSINITITDAAQRLGLRHGDPVTVMVAGQSYVNDRSGLVVPARIGQPVAVSLPAGNYSLAGLGARRESLFTAPDPYSAMAGGAVQVAGPSWANLPLTARNTVTPRLGWAAHQHRFPCSWHFRREHGDWWDRTRQRAADFWENL